MADQLVGTRAADAFDTKGEIDMFEDRVVTKLEDLAQKLFLLRFLPAHQFID